MLVEASPAKLSTRAFDVLLSLIERRDRVVIKSELFDVVWPGWVVEENNLQVPIWARRKLLGPLTISTIPGRGYIEGNIDAARRLYEECLRVERASGDRLGTMIGLNNLAICAVVLNQPMRACDTLLASLSISEELGSRRGRLLVMEVCAGSRRRLNNGRLRRALMLRPIFTRSRWVAVAMHPMLRFLRRWLSRQRLRLARKLTLPPLPPDERSRTIMQSPK